MYRQSVKPHQTTTNDGELAVLAIVSGESENRLQLFVKVHQNKFFSKQTAYEAFAGVARKKPLNWKWQF